MTDYYKTIQIFKEWLVDYVDNLFSVYEHELKLELANYNVLSRTENNIESSTAIGFILEEFIIAKLKSFTEHKKSAKFIVNPAQSAHLSYDCFADFNNIRFLINIKCAKKTNDAIAAITKLHSDYCNDDTEKSFVILKIFYSFTKKDSERSILINDYDIFCLEEVDFSRGHVQDHRNWSIDTNNLNSGRLNVSNNFRINDVTPAEDVTFINTKNQIEAIFSHNDHSSDSHS